MQRAGISEEPFIVLSTTSVLGFSDISDIQLAGMSTKEEESGVSEIGI